MNLRQYLETFLFFGHGGASVKKPACQCRRLRRCGFDHWIWKIPWRRAWQPISVFWPGESPWTEEPGGVQPMGSQSDRTEVTLHACKNWNIVAVFKHILVVLILYHMLLLRPEAWAEKHISCVLFLRYLIERCHVQSRLKIWNQVWWKDPIISITDNLATAQKVLVL